VTMLRAISLACSRSFDVPLETSPNTICSAASGEQNDHLVFQLSCGREKLFSSWELLGVAQGSDPAWDYGHLVERFGARYADGNKGMAGLMEGNPPLLQRAQYAVLSLGPCNHPVDRVFKVIHDDFVAVVAHRQTGCLIHDIGQISTHEARRTLRHDVQIDTF